MMYWPSTKVAVAIQVNVSAPYPRGLAGVIVRAARVTGTP